MPGHTKIFFKNYFSLILQTFAECSACARADSRKDPRWALVLLTDGKEILNKIKVTTVMQNYGLCLESYM